MIFSQFTNTTHTTVAQVVDIVDFSATVAQFDQYFDRIDNVFVRERTRTFCCRTSQTSIDLHTANAGQIVRFFREEQTIHQHFNRFLCGRFTRTHHAVNGHAGRHLIRRFINTQRIGDKATLIQFVGINRLEALDLGFTQFGQQFFGDFIVSGCQHFTGFAINDVFGQHTANQEIIVDRNCLHISHLTDMTSRDALVLSDNHFTVTAYDIETSHFTLQAFRHKRHRGTASAELKGIEFEERFKNLFRIHAQSLEQNRHRHLTTTVNTEVDEILCVKFKIKPRTAVRNHTSGEKQLARAVRLALVMFKEQTRRTVQLADNHTLRTVDDEGGFFRH